MKPTNRLTSVQDPDFAAFLEDADRRSESVYGVPYMDIRADLAEASLDIAKGMHERGFDGATFIDAVAARYGFREGDGPGTRAVAALAHFADAGGWATDADGAAYRRGESGTLVRIVPTGEGGRPGFEAQRAVAPDAVEIVNHRAFGAESTEFVTLGRAPDPSASLAVIATAAMRDAPAPAAPNA